MQSFEKEFHQYVTPKDTLILAVSGGVDSMVLLDLVSKNHPHDKILVAHLDHSLRGDESDGDRKFVANICDKKNIACEVKKMDIGALAKAQKMSIETSARTERYAFLEQMKTFYNATYILTAHHQDDQIETIIINLTKGAKLRGLSGMSVISGHIFRPLLFTPKEVIYAYQKENAIAYRADSSNDDTTYERNRIRHDIIPVLSALNPRIQEMFGELALYMQEMTEFVREYVEIWMTDAFTKSGKEKSFFASDFLALSPLMRGEVISYLYSEAQGGSTHGLSRGLIEELTRFIGDPGSYGKKEIKNLHLERRGERIFIL